MVDMFKYLPPNKNMATAFVLKILIELRPKYIHCYTLACLKRNALRSMYVQYIKWVVMCKFLQYGENKCAV